MRCDSRILSLILLFSLFAFASYGQDAITPGTLTTYTSVYCIGFEWPCTGDANHNSVCYVQYCKQGDTTWKNGMNLIHCDNYDVDPTGGHNGYYGNLFFLNPGTAYDIRLYVDDPDGGSLLKTTSATTKIEPVMPANRTFHVIPGSGGGDGSAGNPFQGVSAAEGVAAAGDRFLLHAGNYGVVNLTKVGASNNWIVWTAAGDGDAVLKGLTMKSYTWADGLHFQFDTDATMNDQHWANYRRATGLSTLSTFDGTRWNDTSASNSCVTRCTFRDFYYTIKMRSGSGWFIADNDIRGYADPIDGGLGQEGVELSTTSNQIVCYNKITRVSDGISYPSYNCDIYGNDIQDVSDDGIETDHGQQNVRVWCNRMTNPHNSAFSSQPMTRGPWFFIRNQITMTRHDMLASPGRPWKFASGDDCNDRFVMINNTMVVPERISEYAQCFLQTFSRNNLYIGFANDQTVNPFWRAAWNSKGGPGVSATAFWETDIDYDGFDYFAKPAGLRFVWFGVPYDSVAAYAAGVGIEYHGKDIHKEDVFENWAIPSTVYDTAPVNWTLKAISNAIDAGQYVPNLNDDMTGSAPDLGALEYGVPPPHYGPRPLTSGPYTLTVTSGSGSGVFMPGDIAPISADTAPVGKTFDKWTGDTDYVVDYTAASTTVVMPAKAMQVTAAYKNILYTLTVNSGTGSGSYAAGAVANIAASAPPAGMAFYKWTGDTSYVANVNASSTSVTMPAGNVIVTATYQTAYTLTVNTGTGSGSYVAGATASIAANAVPGYVFAKWTGDTATVANVTASSTTLTMPAQNIIVTATFNQLFTLTVNSGTGGGSYIQGQSVPITANSGGAGYTFNRWVGDTASVANVTAASTTVTMPASAVVLTATYTLQPGYQILTVNSGTGSGIYAEGAVVNVAATVPAVGKVFSKWVGDTAAVANVNASSTTITIPASSPVITATYTDAYYTLTVNSGSGDGSYTYLSVVPIAADPAPTGKIFSKWIGDTANVANVNAATTSVTMPPSPVVVTATYVNVNYTLTVTSGTGSGTYVYQQVATIVASAPPSGYAFDKWTGDTATVANVNASSTTLSMPAQNANVTATYALLYALTVTSGTGSGSYKAGQVASISASSPATGYMFDKWTGDTAGVANLTASSTSYTMPASAAALTATYKLQPGYHILIVTSGTGSGVYQEGAVVAIVAAAPPAGKRFDRWTGDTANVAGILASSTTITMPTSDAVVRATYSLIPLYTLTVNSGTGTGSYQEGTGVAIHANTPPAGSVFRQWTGDIQYVLNVYSPDTTLTMPATSGIVVTATFGLPLATPQLRVVNGTPALGTYHEGQTVAIRANNAPQGKVFLRWDGDSAYVADIYAPNTTVTMPNIDVTVAAFYVNVYSLTVTSGTGSGSYGQGANVNVTATVPGGMVFSEWTGAVQYLADRYSASTTVTIPAGNVSIAAHFVTPAQLHSLTVTKGNGSGTYPEGRIVDILADPPIADYEFDKWIGDVGTIADYLSPSTTLTMPTHDIAIIATYKPADVLITFPTAAGTAIERGSKVNITWNSPGITNTKQLLRIELTNGAGESWMLTEKANAKKGIFAWTVGKWKSKTGQPVYPDGDTYRLRISSADGSIMKQSADPFAIARVTSLEIIGPSTVNENDMAQFTCWANFNFGEPQDYTLKKIKWTTTSKAAKMKLGLLTVKAVLADEPCTINAVYGKAPNIVTGSCSTLIKNQ